MAPNAESPRVFFFNLFLFSLCLNEPKSVRCLVARHDGRERRCTHRRTADERVLDPPSPWRFVPARRAGTAVMVITLIIIVIITRDDVDDDNHRTRPFVCVHVNCTSRCRPVHAPTTRAQRHTRASASTGRHDSGREKKKKRTKRKTDLNLGIYEKRFASVTHTHTPRQQYALCVCKSVGERVRGRLRLVSSDHHINYSHSVATKTISRNRLFLRVKPQNAKYTSSSNR